MLRRTALDAAQESALRFLDAVSHVRRPAGYDTDGRPRTVPTELYTVTRGERTRVHNPDGTPAVEERPDVTGWWAPGDIERMGKAYAAALNALRLEEGSPTGILEQRGDQGAAGQLGEAGVEELVRWAAENLPGPGA